MKYVENETCYYCFEISKFSADYPLRKGVFSYEGKISRCYWHAQFLCSVCSEYHHFSWLYWCPKSKKLICGYCNEPKLDPIQFWNKTYSWSDFQPLWQFDRTISEYIRALKDAGFVIQEIIEPKPDEETIKQNPRNLAFDADRIPFFIIFDCLKLR